MAEEHQQSAQLGKESSIMAPINDNKVVLVTVHGTEAGDESATGDLWWQLGSPFLVELGKRLELDPERVEIAPFQWEEGPNSEKERRVAGQKLYQTLLSYDNSGKDYYLICHSHGGSVAYNALLESSTGSGQLKGLKCWCTVGTPFLDYRPNRFLFQRLRSLGLVFYATGVCSIILGILTWIKLYMLGPENDLSALRMDELYALRNALIVFGSTCLAGIFFYERWFRKTNGFTNKQKKKTANLYSESWYGLWHAEDEAISALSNIKNVNAAIIPKSFLLPVVAISQLLIVAALGFYIAVDIVANDASDVMELMNQDVASETSEALLAPDTSETLLAPEISETLLAPASWGSDAGYLFIMFGWFNVLFLGMVGLLSFLLKIAARIFGRPLAGILNNVIWSSVRQRAWGDDLLQEDVRAIASHPPEFEDKCGPLPNIIQDPLRKYSSKYAIETLERVREVLGMKPGSSATPDLRSQLTENLKWKELIHTSYFQVSEFIDLLALTLHRAGIGELQKEFSLAPEREMLEAALKLEQSEDKQST